MLSKLEWLLKIINENPTLPIIPMVSGEVIDGDIRNKLVSGERWISSLGDAEIQMYIKGDNGIRLYSDCDYIDTVVESGKYTREECEKLSDDELEKEYNALSWKKAIFLNIDWFED